MGDGPVGPTCGAKLGTGYIDVDTRDRGRACAPGPSGREMSLAPPATPIPGKLTDEQLATMAMLKQDIGLIAESPLGRTPEGREIVGMLKSFNDGKRIAYGDTIEGSRGDWDGKTIRVSAEFQGRMLATIIELVHEASHALWRRRHPRKADKAAQREDDIADELHAQENQLLVYRYLRDVKGFGEDMQMEMRLKRQASGTLRATIEERFAQ